MQQFHKSISISQKYFIKFYSKTFGKYEMHYTNTKYCVTIRMYVCVRMNNDLFTPYSEKSNADAGKLITKSYTCSYHQFVSFSKNYIVQKKCNHLPKIISYMNSSDKRSTNFIEDVNNYIVTCWLWYIIRLFHSLPLNIRPFHPWGIKITRWVWEKILFYSLPLNIQPLQPRFITII